MKNKKILAIMVFVILIALAMVCFVACDDIGKSTESGDKESGDIQSGDIVSGDIQSGDKEEVDLENEGFVLNGVRYIIVDDFAQVKEVILQNSVLLTIPATVSYEDKTYEVKKVSDRAFKGLSCERIVISEGIESLGDYAFMESKVKSIELPQSLKSIGKYAFMLCTQLKNINIPDGITELKEGTFFACSSLESLDIPKSVRLCYSILEKCDNLKELSTPLPITLRGMFGYYEEDADKINVQKIVVKKCDSVSNALKNIDSLREAYIEDGVVLGNYAFYDCDNLQYVRLPQDMETLSSYFFANCISLQSVDIPSSVREISSGVFYGCKALQEIKIPEAVESIGSNAFFDCVAIKEIVLPDSVLEIGANAFKNCTLLKDFKMSSNVRSIGEGAFYNCTLLEEIIIPSAVLTIEKITFSNCTSLKKVDIKSSSVTTIKSDAFTNCDALDELYLPDSATSIDVFAFERQLIIYTNLSQVPDGWHSNIEFYNTIVFESDSNPHTEYGYKPIKSGIFDYLINDSEAIVHSKSLDDKTSSLQIPSQIEYEGKTYEVTGINKYAFELREEIEEIILPESLKIIQSNAFNYCTNLKKAQLLGVEEIGFGSFSRCSSLVEIQFSENLKEINQYAFSECTSLTEMTFPASLRSIKSDSLENCINLQKITFENTSDWIYYDSTTHEKIFVDFSSPEDNIKYFKINSLISNFYHKNV